MATIYPNTMITRAGLYQQTDAQGQVTQTVQALMPGFRQTQYPDNQDYIVVQNDTWQGIALKTLGDASLFWVIAEFNYVLDPFATLVPGARLTVPSAARVRAILTNPQA